MSYSIYHYFEESIKQFLTQYYMGAAIPRLPKKYDIDFTKDYSKVLSFAYIIYNTQKKGISFNNTVADLIANVENKDIQNYIINNLNIFEKGYTDCFQDVASEHIDEVIDYITKINDPKASSGLDRGGLQTPDSIMNLAYKLLDIKANDNVANFCSSTGGFLSMCEDRLQTKNNLVGYELDTDKYVISLMIKDMKKYNYELKHCNVLEADVSVPFTKIFADIPFKIDVNLYTDKLKKLAKNFDEEDSEVVLGEKLFIQKIIDSLTDDGKAFVVVPSFFITSGNCNSFRNYLLTKGYLNCVIQCGFGLIPGTGISVSLLVLSKHNNEVRFIDASSECTKERLLYVFSDENIEHITKAYKAETNLKEGEDFSNKGLCPYKIIKSHKDLLESEKSIKEKHYDLLPYSYVSSSSTKQEGYKTLEELCMVKRGVSFSTKELKDYTTNTEGEVFYYLSQKDMQDGEILYDNLEKLILPKDDTNFKKTKDGNQVCKHLTLQDNDIVLCCLKTKPLKIAMVHCSEDIKIIPSCNLYVIRVNDNLKEKVSPYFIKACLEKDKTYEFIEAKTNTFKILQKTVQQVLIRTEITNDYNPSKIAENYKALQDKIANLQKELANCRDELKDIVESI